MVASSVGRHKTNHYLVVLSTGHMVHKLWGGKASSLKKAMLEDNPTNPPVGIFQWMKPLWSKEGFLING